MSKKDPNASGGASGYDGPVSEIEDILKGTTLEDPDYEDIMTLNFGTGSGTKRRSVHITRPTVELVIKSKSPGLVFVQEISAPKTELKKLNLKDDYGYKNTGNCGLMWGLDTFELKKEMKQDEKDAIRKKLAKRNENEYISVVPTRMCAVLLEHKASRQQLLAISWHGPNVNVKKKTAMDDFGKTKELVFSYLQKFALEMRQCYLKDASGSYPPIVIGGDFNLNLEKLKSSKPEIIEKEFRVRPYKQSERRKEEGKQPLDFFLYTEDIKVENVQAVEMKMSSPNCAFTKEETKGTTQANLFAIDHDPIEAKLFFETQILDSDEAGGDGATSSRPTPGKGGVKRHKVIEE